MKYFMDESPHKGLLLYHQLGSGKTCTAIFIADAMLERGDVARVFVVSPGSLQMNWVNEYCRKCGANQLPEAYQFITSNYKSSIASLNFWDSLVIIDEVHNLVNAAKNDSDLAEDLLQQMKQSNCRVLALSGTPFYNYTYEWSLLGNLLKPNTFQWIFQGDPRQYTSHWEQQESLITDEMLRGIVSFIPGDRSGFPEVILEAPILAPLPDEYSIVYMDAYERERKLIAIGPPDPDLRTIDPDEYRRKNQQFLMAIKRDESRRLSNLFAGQRNRRYVQDPPLPSGAIPPLRTEILADVPVEGKKKRGRKRNEDDAKEEGWMTPAILKRPGLEVISPKIAALFRNLIQWQHLRRKHVIFSQFLSRGGIDFIQTVLGWCGIPTLTYTGRETDVARTKTLDAFNDAGNAYGTTWKVLLITEAGVEGISLFDVGHMHILESNPVGGKVTQAIGRAARYQSHVHLPEADRTVHVWRYHAIPYGDDVEHSVDVQLYRRAELNQEEMDEFLERLQANSIEKTSDYDMAHPYMPPARVAP